MDQLCIQQTYGSALDETIVIVVIAVIVLMENTVFGSVRFGYRLIVGTIGNGTDQRVKLLNSFFIVRINNITIIIYIESGCYCLGSLIFGGLVIGSLQINDIAVFIKFIQTVIVRNLTFNQGIEGICQVRHNSKSVMNHQLTGFRSIIHRTVQVIGAGNILQNVRRNRKVVVKLVGNLNRHRIFARSTEQVDFINHNHVTVAEIVVAPFGLKGISPKTEGNTVGVIAVRIFQVHINS